MPMRALGRIAVATFVLASAARGQVAQQSAARDSVGSIMAFVNDRRTVTEILMAVQVDCPTFSFDALDQTLAGTTGYEQLTPSLKRRCALLRVQSDPANATLKIGGRDMGTISQAGELRWVNPGDAVEVEVSLGNNSKKKTLEIPANKIVQVSFSLPRDTVVLPAVRTPKQVAADLNILSIWRAPAGGPVAPVKPSQMSAKSAGMLWGLVGAAGGALVGQFLQAAGCNKPYKVPGKGAYVNGTKYPAGATVNLGAGVGCTAMMAAGGGVALFTVGGLLKANGNKGANARYQNDLAEFPKRRSAWEEEQLARFLDSSPEVRSLIAQDQQRLLAAQADNTAVRNANLRVAAAEPIVQIREMTETNIAVGSGATTRVASDIDQAIPKGIGANPNAVAIVIGNRDYTTPNVPKVDFAIDDARSIRRYLIDVFGFDSTRVLLKENVTTGMMFNLFGNSDGNASTIADMIKTRDSADVFVFYSGHGAPEKGQRYLVPVDGDFDRLANTGFSIDRLYKNLGSLTRARSVTVVLDACFSGSSAGGAVQRDRSGSDDLEAEVDVAQGLSRVYTAVTAKQTARWHREQGHGLFTYYFLKGIRGEADANGDKAVTDGELSDYLKLNVTRFAIEKLSAPQDPQIKIGDPSKVLVRLAPR